MPDGLEGVLAEVGHLRAEVEALRRELARMQAEGRDGLPARATFESPLDARGNSPPLDSPVVWSRFHRQVAPGPTSQLLSLIFEAEGPGAFPWPLYIQLVSRTTPPGDATGVYVRLFNEGSGWGAAYHTDLYHLGSGTSIGANVELTRTDSAEGLPGGEYGELPPQPAGRAIGVNIQNTAHSRADGDQAVNIQGGPGRSWRAAVNIEDQNAGREGVAVGGSWEHGVRLKGRGGAGITIDGAYEKGLSLDHNDIHLSSGSRIYLDDAAQVYLCFNPDQRRVELVYTPQGVVAAFPLNEAANAPGDGAAPAG
jgi:hypothetical protein